VLSLVEVYAVVNKRFLAPLSALFALLLVLTPSTVAAQSTSPADHALSNGWFYTQTSDQAERGFAVIDDADARFWIEFQRLGGVPGVGYPISQRYVWDGFVSPAFQKMVFQWRLELGHVAIVNVVDQIHKAGLDPWLQAFRATPPMADWSADADRTWPEIVAAHQALLTEPEIRATYFAVADPIALYGLPMAPIEDLGDVLVLRAQRANHQPSQARCLV
jgi:hypothetical protein